MPVIHTEIQFIQPKKTQKGSIKVFRGLSFASPIPEINKTKIDDFLISKNPHTTAATYIEETDTEEKKRKTTATTTQNRVHENPF